MRALFLSRNIYEKYYYMCFTCSIIIYLSQFLYVTYGIWRCLKYDILSNKHTEIQRFLHMLSCSTLLFFAKSKKRPLHEYPSFGSTCMFWYVLFYKNVIVVFHHGDNAFLFYFYICIKFIFSTIIATMRKCECLPDVMWTIS